MTEQNPISEWLKNNPQAISEDFSESLSFYFERMKEELKHKKQCSFDDFAIIDSFVRADLFVRNLTLAFERLRNENNADKKTLILMLNMHVDELEAELLKPYRDNKDILKYIQTKIKGLIPLFSHEPPEQPNTTPKQLHTEPFINSLLAEKIIEKYGKHFKGETIETWKKRFYLYDMPLPTIEVETDLIECNNKVILFGILKAIQDNETKAKFDFNSMVKNNFGFEFKKAYSEQTAKKNRTQTGENLERIKDEVSKIITEFHKKNDLI
jgi:hypothetical protein